MEDHSLMGQAGRLSPAALAYIGDAVFELFVREALAAQAKGAAPRILHRRATSLVRASAQARMARELAPELTEEESAVLRRGRNAHCGRVPQGVEVAEYRLATGFESLIGFLYLCGRTARLRELLSKALRLSVKEGTW